MTVNSVPEITNELGVTASALGYALGRTISQSELALLSQYGNQIASLSNNMSDAYVIYTENGGINTLEHYNSAMDTALAGALGTLASLAAERILISASAGIGFGPHGVAISVAVGTVTAFVEWSGFGEYFGYNSNYTKASDESEIIIAGPENSSAYLKGGDDIFISRSALFSYTVYGGSGHDSIYLQSSSDQAYGDDGNDVIYIGFNGGEAYGDAGDDILYGASGADDLTGGADADLILGKGGDDTIGMGTSSQAVSSSNFGDRAVGGEGKDVIYGTNGGNIIIGDDLIQAELDLSWFEHAQALMSDLDGISYEQSEEGGDDTIFAGGEQDLVSGGKGGDVIEGEGGDDYLFGDEGDDHIYGGADSDHLFGGTGEDALNGGAGFDVAAYWFAKEKVTVDLADSSRNTGEAAGDTFDLIEVIRGSKHDDTIVGGEQDIFERFSGEDGADTIYAGSIDVDIYGDDGDDILSGGKYIHNTFGEQFTIDNGETNHLYGGTGDDTFVFSRSTNWDGSPYITGGINVNGYGGKYASALDISLWSEKDEIHDYEGNDSFKIYTFLGSESSPMFSYADEFSDLTSLNPTLDIWAFVESKSDLYIFYGGLGAKKSGSDAYFFAYIEHPEAGMNYEPLFIVRDFDFA